mmetsp:Transcript_83961/g.211625  ORF Transcript_83961/g.211625 Transcript_83961/m.211625 type:complete len:875 (+) Transcript_83961:1-2625(+)
MCRDCIKATSAEKAAESGSPSLREVREDLKQLEATVRAHTARLQHCASDEDLADCLRERDRLALQQHVDKRFEGHLEQLLAHRAELEGAAQVGREAASQRCTAMEKWLQEQQDRTALLAKQVVELRAELKSSSKALEVQLRCNSEELVAKVVALEKDIAKQAEEQQTSMAAYAQQLEGITTESRAASRVASDADTTAQRLEVRMRTRESRVDALIDSVRQVAERATTELSADARSRADALAKRLDHMSEELKSATVYLEQQADRTVAEARSAADRSRVAALAAEEAGTAAQGAESRAAAAELRVGTVESSVRQHLDSTVAELRTEVRTTVESAERRLRLAAEDAHKAVSTLRQHVDQVVSEVAKDVRLLERQLAQIQEDVTTVGENSRLAKHSSEEAATTSRHVGGQLSSFEARLDASLSAVRQRIDTSVAELQAGMKVCISSSEGAVKLDVEALRGSVAALKSQHGSALEELQLSTASLTKRTESVLEQATQVGEQGRTAIRVAEDAAALAQRVEKAVEGLRGERPDEMAVVERIEDCRQQAKSIESELLDQIEKLSASDDQLQAMVADLQSAVGRLDHRVDSAAEQARTAAEEAHGAVEGARGAAEDARSAHEKSLAAAEAAEVAGTQAEAAEVVAVRVEKVTLEAIEALEARGVSPSPDVCSSRALDQTAEDLREEAERHRVELEKRFAAELSELQDGMGDRISALAREVGQAMEAARSERAAAQMAVEVGLSAQRHADQLEWLEALDGHRAEMRKQRSELETLCNQFVEQQGRVTEVEGGVRHVSASVENLADSFAGLDSRLAARIKLWDKDVQAIREKFDTLQTGVEGAKQGFATIQNAFSVLHKLEDGTGGTLEDQPAHWSSGELVVR